MDTSRKLDRIADNLDDMSVTLEEIKEDIGTTEALDTAKLDRVQAEMEKATEMIEECIDPADQES
jgi:hypothetical protein